MALARAEEVSAVEDHDVRPQGAPVAVATPAAEENLRGPTPASHAEAFECRAGMTPRACYHLIQASLILRLIALSWMGMVALEYSRYYVINDLGRLDVLRMAITTPQYAFQAFLFPFWGVVADRVSRRKILAAASLAASASAWLLTFFPSVWVFILTSVFALVSDLGGPVRAAMLRDILSTDEWETHRGGITGVKSRLLLTGQVAFGFATAFGMAILLLGKHGYGLPNEFTEYKDECGEVYCLPEGQFSRHGFWGVDGCLRLLMIMGSAAMTADAVMVCAVFPDTLPLEFHRETSLWRFIKSDWQEAGRPWNNLRVFATPQLRSLMAISLLGYIATAGLGSIYMSFYNRFEFDTFTMTGQAVLGGIAAWCTMAAVGRLVDRYGDLKGVWLPGIVLLLLLCISGAALPPGYGYMVFAIAPLFGGTSGAFSGVAPELLGKLIPSDLQATFQTAKSFVFRLTMATFGLPWNQLFVHTRDLGYPLDGCPTWAAFFIGVVALILTLRKLRDDPRDAIMQGKAMDAFWESPQANGLSCHRHPNSSGQPSASADDDVPEVAYM